MKGRIIKFRAWDKEENNYIYFDALDGLSDHCDEAYRQRAVGVFEQYTGLTDKNGKEIYEGDIVEVAYGQNINVFRRPVYQSESGAWVIDLPVINSTDAKGEPMMIYYMRAEIIGTIHDKEIEA